MITSADSQLSSNVFNSVLDPQTFLNSGAYRVSDTGNNKVGAAFSDTASWFYFMIPTVGIWTQFNDRLNHE